MIKYKIIINKCGYCERDLHLLAKNGGCFCPKQKDYSGKSTLYNINKTLDYYDKFYDGYGVYDATRRNIDQDEILTIKE